MPSTISNFAPWWTQDDEDIFTEFSNPNNHLPTKSMLIFMSFPSYGKMRFNRLLQMKILSAITKNCRMEN